MRRTIAFGLFLFSVGVAAPHSEAADARGCSRYSGAQFRECMESVRQSVTPPPRAVSSQFALDWARTRGGRCPVPESGSPKESWLLYGACVDAVDREAARQAKEQSLRWHRRGLAQQACQEAGLVGQAWYDCAIIVEPSIDCDPQDFNCRDRALAIARQARRQADIDRQAIERDERRTRALEDANRPRTCTSTRSRVYPYEITTVCE